MIVVTIDPNGHVHIETDPTTAKALTGRTDPWATQAMQAELAQAVAVAWYEAGCPPGMTGMAPTIGPEAAA